MNEKKYKKICKVSVRVDEKMYQELTEKAKAYQCTISDVVIARLKNDSPAMERERVFQSVMKVAVLLEKQEFSYKNIDHDKIRKELLELCTMLNL